jgi:hypothetical protein
LGVTNWDLRRWGIRQVYAAEARDGTKTRLERVERGPQGSRYVKFMDEWTQVDIRREGKRTKNCGQEETRAQSSDSAIGRDYSSVIATCSLFYSVTLTALYAYFVSNGKNILLFRSIFHCRYG